MHASYMYMYVMHDMSQSSVALEFFPRVVEFFCLAVAEAPTMTSMH